MRRLLNKVGVGPGLGLHQNATALVRVVTLIVMHKPRKNHIPGESRSSSFSGATVMIRRQRPIFSKNGCSARGYTRTRH